MTDQDLRNVILLASDFMEARAEQLERLSKSNEARSVLEKRLAVAAITNRQCAEILHSVLASTEPKAEAS
jgi:hypothetical protein